MKKKGKEKDKVYASSFSRSKLKEQDRIKGYKEQDKEKAHRKGR